MGMKLIKRIPSADEIIEQIPLPKHIKEIKADRDRVIKKILQDEEKKFLLIIGPCSADNEDSVCEYIGKLAEIQEKVKDSIIIMPRIYTNKPRTTGEGYKGMVHQPDPNKKADLCEGIKAIRKMQIGRASCRETV